MDKIADLALSRAKTLISRYRDMPEGRARASMLLRASAWNFLRRLARPTDRAFINGEQHG